MVLRVIFRIFLDHSSGLRRLRAANGAKDSQKRRSQRFLRCTIVPHPAVHPLSPSDLCRSIRRLTKQVVTPLRERLTRACRYLLASLPRLVKGATFISPVWSQSSKSSALVSLLSHEPPNVVVKTPSRAHVTSRNLSCFRSSSSKNFS